MVPSPLSVGNMELQLSSEDLMITYDRLRADEQENCAEFLEALNKEPNERRYTSKDLKALIESIRLKGNASRAAKKLVSLAFNLPTEKTTTAAPKKNQAKGPKPRITWEEVEHATGKTLVDLVKNFIKQEDDLMAARKAGKIDSNANIRNPKDAERVRMQIVEVRRESIPVAKVPEPIDDDEDDDEDDKDEREFMDEIDDYDNDLPGQRSPHGKDDDDIVLAPATPPQSQHPNASPFPASSPRESSAVSPTQKPRTSDEKSSSSDESGGGSLLSQWDMPPMPEEPQPTNPDEAALQRMRNAYDEIDSLWGERGKFRQERTKLATDSTMTSKMKHRRLEQLKVLMNLNHDSLRKALQEFVPASEHAIEPNKFSEQIRRFMRENIGPQKIAALEEKIRIHKEQESAASTLMPYADLVKGRQNIHEVSAAWKNILKHFPSDARDEFKFHWREAYTGIAVWRAAFDKIREMRDQIDNVMHACGGAFAEVAHILQEVGPPQAEPMDVEEEGVIPEKGKEEAEAVPVSKLKATTPQSMFAEAVFHALRDVYDHKLEHKLSKKVKLADLADEAAIAKNLAEPLLNAINNVLRIVVNGKSKALINEKHFWPESEVDKVITSILANMGKPASKGLAEKLEHYFSPLNTDPNSFQYFIDRLRYHWNKHLSKPTAKGGEAPSKMRHMQKLLEW